jgi:hypothetical protein
VQKIRAIPGRLWTIAGVNNEIVSQKDQTLFSLMQRALEQELDDLKPNLVTLIESNGGKLKTGEISAWLNKRATYQFSLEVQQIEQLLKNKKEEEKRMGSAEVVYVTVFPVVR